MSSDWPVRVVVDVCCRDASSVEAKACTVIPEPTTVRAAMTAPALLKIVMVMSLSVNVD
jgi:hypothetical protein